MSQLRVVARAEDFGITGEESVRRMEAQLGQPFVSLPGNPPEWKIVGEIDGHKVRVKDIEMVYNDTLFVEGVYGLGCHDKVDPPNSLMAKVRKLAFEMYKERAQ